MTAKSRPQDNWNADQIARATGYTASIFCNGKHNTVDADTLEAAIEIGKQMNQIVKNGRKATVYAVTPEGFTIWVCNPHQLAA